MLFVGSKLAYPKSIGDKVKEAVPPLGYQWDCIHQYFESIAELFPDRTAVVDNLGSISYAELNANANRLANLLRKHYNVLPDTAVCVYMSSSRYFATAILAILKAGGAYVPLDLHYPGQRISTILESSSSPLVLTTTDAEKAFPVEGTHLICVDDHLICAGMSSENPDLVTSSEHLAYILFTSGSTGEPKGVMLRHSNLINLCHWGRDYFAMPGGEQVGQTARIVFDVSVWEYWICFYTGNTLHIIDKLILLDMKQLNKVIIEKELNHLFLATAICELFLDDYSPQITSLKTLLTGGDRLLKRPDAAFPARLFNALGPAECCVINMCKEVEVSNPEHRNPSLGFPLPGIRIYILDSDLQPVPIGEPGEICIAGNLVGRGYVGRPELTEKLFIPNPDPEYAGEIFYRSGDTGRFYPNGEIDFIGRMDFQVKIRGNRVELGEIETILVSHPQVSQCCALAFSDTDGEKSIAAYIVTISGQEIYQADLDAFLLNKLPDYMIPSRYIFIEALPITPNGKIDRTALPLPELSGKVEDTTTESFASSEQREIYTIWKDVLKLNNIKLTDKFYSLGGHSLKATQIVSRIRKTLGVDMGMGFMLENPSLEETFAAFATAEKEHFGEISHQEGKDYYPLSWAQNGMLYYWNLDNNRLDYHVILRVEIVGELDLQLLGTALQMLIYRHETLRTGYEMKDGVPTQFVYPTYPIELPLTEISDYMGRQDVEGLTYNAFNGLSAQLMELEKKLGNEPFDMRKGKLLRFSLAKYAPDGYILYIVQHHISTDGWSLGVFLRDLKTIYCRLLTRDTRYILPPLPVNYGDVATWQKSEHPRSRYPHQLEYWKQKLLPFAPEIRLPAKLDYKFTDDHTGNRLWWKLPAESTLKIRELVSREGKSLYTVLLSIYKLLLMKYSGETDLVVGSSYAGRDRTETQDLIGLFTNLVSLRTDMSGEPTYREFLHRVHETTTGAFSHADYPFEQLVKDLGYQVDAVNHPIFTIMFILQNYPLDQQGFPGMDVHLVEIGNHTAKFDLLLTIEESEDDLICWFEYKTAMMDDTIVRQMANHYNFLCAQICENPDKKITHYDIILPAEKQQLVYDWNQTTASFDTQTTYSQLWEKAVKLHPERIAVVCPTEPETVISNAKAQLPDCSAMQLTYAELDAYSNALCGYLLSKGCTPGGIIGICLPRSSFLAIALLAVWKSGCAYLPLDQDFPQDRLNYIYQDSGLSVLITTLQIKEKLPFAVPHTICLDDTATDWQTQSVPTLPKPESIACADDPAYVIYTSGSTGQPKGVVLTHRNLVNHNQAVVSAFGLTAADRVLQFGSISFDLSVEEIFPTWLAGACLVFRTEAVMTSMDVFLDFIAEQQITVMDIPTAFWHELVYALTVRKLPESVRLCIIGGEKAANDKLVLWNRHTDPSVRLLNTYGPTETTIIATIYEPDRTEIEEFPIGKPISNYFTYILDARLRPLPVGVVGELYIGGKGVGKGYLGKAELTKERFLPNPFIVGKQEYIYKTGDLAEYRPDGNIMFAGRVDDQVKFLGHRIELGEIELLLRQLSGVKDAIVVLIADNPDHHYLCSYLVCTDPSLDKLRINIELQKHLPAYMIPAQTIFLPELPYTTQGKVNKRALPQPHLDSQQKVFTLARTVCEKRVAAVWGKVFGLDQLDVNSSFAELGGHSLKAMQTVALLRKEFGRDISLKEFLEHPTLAEQAMFFEIATMTDSEQYVFNIPSLSRDREAYPLSFAQEGLWLLWELDESKISYNIPICFCFSGYLDVDKFNLAWEIIHSRHEVLHSRILLSDGKPYIKPDMTLPAKCEIMDISAGAQTIIRSKALQLAKEVSATRLDLYQGDVYRAVLIKLAEDRWDFVFVIHHIIADGWSIANLGKEIKACYTAIFHDQEVSLPGLQIQYLDYAVWQNETLYPQIEAKQAVYWQKQLLPLPEPLSMHYKAGRPAQQAYRGQQIRFNLSVSELAMCKKLCLSSEISLFTLLLAALDLLYYKYTGQTDIVIGTPFANRYNSQLDGVVGCFTNMLPLRVIFMPEEKIADLLGRANITCREAYSHADYPFHKLVSLLEIPRDPSRHPIYQVMLTMQNYDVSNLDFCGIVTKTEVVNNHSAKLDMSWDFAETTSGLEGIFEYNTDLFSDAFCGRLVMNFITLLSNMVKAPEQTIRDVNSLSRAEKLLMPPAVPLPAYDSVWQWIQDTAQNYPEQPALRFEGQALNYTELTRKVRQAANYFLDLGLAPGAIVGLCLQRSPEMVIYALAAWSVGCGYIYLDPEFPEERLAFMVDDVLPAIVIVHRELTDKISYPVTKILIYEEHLPEVQLRTEQKNDVELKRTDTAYIIFTSGSTGKPKGVEIGQLSVLNFLNSMLSEPGLTKADRLAAITPLSFDISILEVFLPLICGAELHILSRQVAMDGIALSDYLAEKAITVFQATPSSYKLLLDSGWQGKPDLIALIGGEAVDSSLAAQLLPKTKQLWNMYGPTETTVWSSIYLISDASQPILIGKPIANTQMYVLDGYLHSRPMGAIGELYIGGAGLAKGYWQREEQTAERFIDFTGQTDTKIYKTGDLVSICDDGNLEYHGRNDFQVKIRGHRIELGEIAAWLRKHPLVKDAVVIADNGLYEQKQLLAYLIGGAELPASTALKTFLRSELPDYMIPSHFHFIEEFPLTANGKIDLNALSNSTPKLTTARDDDPKTEFVKPYTPEQEILCQAVCDILHLEKVSVKSNFFEAGGNSILSMQLMSRLSQAGLVLTIDKLFRHQTLEELAGWLTLKNLSENTFGSFSLVEMQKGTPDRKPLFLIHPLPGDVLGYVNLVHHINPRQPVYGFQALGLLDKASAHRTIPETAAYYISIIKKMELGNNFFLGGWCYGGSVAVEMSNQLRKEGIILPAVFLFDTWAFNPVPELKLRYVIHRLKVAAHNYQRIGILVRSKLKERKGYQVVFDRENVFQDQGIFENRSHVRKINLSTILCWKMSRCDNRLILFKAAEQHPDLIHDWTLGWKVFASDITVHKINATHDNILKEPQIFEVLEMLEPYLS